MEDTAIRSGSRTANHPPPALPYTCLPAEVVLRPFHSPATRLPLFCSSYSSCASSTTLLFYPTSFASSPLHGS